jgi:Protein of unknown function (DUF4011)
LTGRERSGSGVLPGFVQGQVSMRAGLVQKAATDWKNALVDLGGRNNLLHYRDLKQRTLDLTAADPDAIAGLLRGKATRVSALFGDPVQRDEVLRRVRTIHNRAKENFEERGLETLSIGCGLATWENKRAAWEPCAPDDRLPDVVTLLCGPYYAPFIYGRHRYASTFQAAEALARAYWPRYGSMPKLDECRRPWLGFESFSWLRRMRATEYCRLDPSWSRCCGGGPVNSSASREGGGNI